jgi:type VI secretion system protein ImpM
MIADSQIGLYGKLPAYGDFIFRNLNSSFITPWDEWLQHFISGSQEQMGEDWLNIYLTSPIWRFVLSPGVIDSKMWAGLLMPSVDRVGRYFPISLVKPFEENINPVKFMLDQSSWFDALEANCLSALDGSVDADALIAAVNQIELLHAEDYQSTFNLGEIGPMLFGIDPENNPMQTALPYMLNAALTTGLSSYSLWQTSGSQLISPMLFSCQGLPPIGGIASMLDGQWQQRDWKIPYNLQAGDV